MIDRRNFLKNTSILGFGTLLTNCNFSNNMKTTIKTAHIGVGGMGKEDLNDIASHEKVEVFALCDVDNNALVEAGKLFPKAKLFRDYRVMLETLNKEIDAVIVSAPDHVHAPASIMAMQYDKHVYCQKPLTHHVSEAREMKRIAEKKNLITQMGIQVHSFYDYKLATLLIQSGLIGKVSKVRAWSDKVWGYDGPKHTGSDDVPKNLDWNLWLGTAKERPYKDKVFHPQMWRKLVDFGCGTLGDMGVHIFDTPYNALELDVPLTIKNICREPNNYAFAEENYVEYVFPGTKHTTKTLKWIWEDGINAPKNHSDLELPNSDKLPSQGAMFMGENGKKLLLPHFMEIPKLIVDGKYENFEVEEFVKNGDLSEIPVRDYAGESHLHYHQFIDACLGKDKCTAPFSYSSRLTETILLGVIASRFPGKTLNWDSDKAKFREDEANKYLNSPYRNF